MTKNECAKVMQIYNKMITNGLQNYNFGFLGEKTAYILTHEEYNFIKPFFTFRYETKLHFPNGTEMVMDGTDGLTIFTNKDTDEVAIHAETEIFIVLLHYILNFSIALGCPYKYFTEGGTDGSSIH